MRRSASRTTGCWTRCSKPARKLQDPSARGTSRSTPRIGRFRAEWGQPRRRDTCGTRKQPNVTGDIDGSSFTGKGQSDVSPGARPSRQPAWGSSGVMLPGLGAEAPSSAPRGRRPVPRSAGPTAWPWPEGRAVALAHWCSHRYRASCPVAHLRQCGVGKRQRPCEAEHRQLYHPARAATRRAAPPCRPASTVSERRPRRRGPRTA